MGIWQNDDGKPIVDADGKIIECDDRPCDGPCPGETVACAACPEGSGPQSYFVTIPAIGNNGMLTCCGNFAGTYELPFIGLFAGVCFWQISGVEDEFWPGCNPNGTGEQVITLRIVGTVGSLNLFEGGGQRAQWNATGITACLGTITLTPHHSGGDVCSNTNNATAAPV